MHLAFAARRLAGAIALFTLILMSVSVAGSEPEASDSPIVVSQDHAWPPFSFKNRQGEPRGLLIDVWEEIGRKLDRPVKFKLTDWGLSLDQVREGEADVHGGLFHSPSRAEFMDFSEPLLPLSTALFVPSELMIPSIDELDERIVGVVEGSFELEHMRTEHPDIALRLFRNNERMVRAAVDGEVAGFVADYPVGLFLLDRYSEPGQFRPLQVLYSRPLLAGVAQGDEQLLDEINTVLADLDEETLRQITQAWIASAEVEVVPAWVLPAVLTGALITGLLVWALMLRHQRRGLRERIEQRTQELVDAREALQQTLDIHTRVADNVPGVVFTFAVDREQERYCFPFISDRVEALFGVSAAQLNEDATPLIEKMHPEDVDAYLDSVSHAVEKGVGWNHQARLRVTSGEYRWFEGQSEPHWKAPGHLEWHGYFSDIELHKAMEAALRRSENQFRQFVENAGEIIFTVNDHDRLDYVSPNWTFMLGHPLDEVLGQRLNDWVHPDDRQMVFAFLHEVLRTGQRNGGVEYRFLHGDGYWRWYTCNASRIHDDFRDESLVLIMAHDISERVQARSELMYQARFQRLIASISSEFANIRSARVDPAIQRALSDIGEFFRVDRAYLYRLSDDGKTQTNTHEWCAPGASSLIDSQQRVPLDSFNWWRLQLEERIYRNDVIFIDSVDDLPDEADAERTLLQGQGVRSMFCVPILSSGQVTGFLGVDSLTQRQWRTDQADLLTVVANLLSEVLEKNRLEQDLLRLSVTDPLTGLYNRRFLMDRLHEMLAEYDRSGKPLAVVMLDLDRFKALNDTHGHHAGDAVLVQFARTLREHVRPFDVVARYGGEEFVVLLSGATSEEARHMAQRMIEQTRTIAVENGDAPLTVTVSAGVSSVTEFPETVDANTLIARADQRLYQAKSSGRDQVVSVPEDDSGE